MKRPARALIAAACVAAIAVPSRALAVTCDSIPSGANPGAATAPTVYIEGATAVGSFLAPLQQALSIDPNPINLVYIGDGGCLGASNFFLNMPISRRPAPVYYAAESKETCDLPTAGFGRVSPTADIAVSDVYAPSCGTLSGGQLPPHVGDFLGPIQTMAFAVPTASTQRAMSAKGAYFVFGFGAGSGVAPWTVNSSIYRRNGSSAVQALFASAIGVPLLRWMGVDASGIPENIDAGLSNGSAVVNALDNDPSPEQSIGILSDTDIDATVAGRIRVLAYKDNDQNCAYYPDSTATARDKVNVRDGHYTLWGPIHFFTYVDSRGVAQNPLVGRVISYLIGTAAAPGGVDIVQTDADNRLVPACAMHVARSVEMGPLMSVAPPASCSCYYDYVASGQSTCQACAKEADCPPSAPVCNLSHPVAFCETQ
jgi:hypothetical protein